MLCLLCFSTYQQPKIFTYIRFLDFSRLFYCLILQIITFINDSTDYYEYILDGLTNFSLLTQTYLCFNSLTATISKEDSPYHKKYLVSKIFFIISSLLKIFLRPFFFCNENIGYFKCFSNKLGGFCLLDLLWSLIDLNFFFLGLCFYAKMKRGVYSPVGGTFIYDIHIESCKNGLTLEVKGEKSEEKHQEKGIVILIDKKNNVGIVKIKKINRTSGLSYHFFHRKYKGRKIHLIS